MVSGSKIVNHIPDLKNLNKQTTKVGQLVAAATHHVIGRRQTVKVKQRQGNVVVKD